MKFRFTHFMFSSLPITRERDIMLPSKAADCANAALDEHLKLLPRVYGNTRQLDVVPAPTASDTHAALLWDLEELKPKECEHVALSQYGHKGKFSCNDCGKVLEYRLVEV